jgi:hypothetical protein
MIFMMSCGEEKPINNEPSVKTVANKIDSDKTPATESVKVSDEAAPSNETDAHSHSPQSATSDDSNENTNSANVTPRRGGFAEITFEKMRYDFGTIEEGDVISHTFKFFNTGTGDLVISDATATCGCTRPDFPFTPIAPQEAGTINVSFNSTGKNGKQRKPITIISNATDKRMTVYLQGNVVPKGTLNKEEVIQTDPDSTSSN